MHNESHFRRALVRQIARQRHPHWYTSFATSWTMVQVWETERQRGTMKDIWFLSLSVSLGLLVSCNDLSYQEFQVLALLTAYLGL